MRLWPTGAIYASSGANRWIIPISQAGTYVFSRSSAPCAVASIPNFAKAALRLTSDSGQVDYLVPISGSIYLTPGNWTGQEVIEGSTRNASRARRDLRPSVVVPNPHAVQLTHHAGPQRGRRSRRSPASGQRETR